MKKIIVILVLALLGWWASGFVNAIIDHRGGMKAPAMKAKTEQFKDPVRKSGYRTYAQNFTDEKPSRKALDEVLGN